MTDGTEPQETPGVVPGSEEGQSEEVTQVAPTPEVVDDTATKLQEAEKRNKDLEFRLTQQGRVNADLRRGTQPTQVVEEDIPAETYFSDPVGVTKKVVTNVLAEYESRQEQRRQAEEFLQLGAEARGSTPHRLLALHRQLQQASQDNPDEYLDILSAIDKAQDTAAEIQKASKTAVETATRNARAVTTEGGSTQVSPPAKSESEMSVAELREHLVKKHGELPYE